MNKKERAIIQNLEEQYDSFQPKLAQLQKTLADFQEAYESYIALTDFYGSEEWFRWREQPVENLKCGILSEDQLFDLIEQHNSLLEKLLDLSAQMYRHR